MDTLSDLVTKDHVTPVIFMNCLFCSDTNDTNVRYHMDLQNITRVDCSFYYVYYRQDKIETNDIYVSLGDTLLLIYIHRTA